MTDAEKRDIVENAVDNLSEWELLGIWNDYCDYNNYCDDRVYYVSDLDELCYSMKPTEIISRYGELDGFEYFKDGVYTEGSNDLLDLIDYGALIDYIIDNETGIKCNPFSEKEYYEGIIKLSDPLYRKKMHDKCVQMAKKYDISISITERKKIYEEILN